MKVVTLVASILSLFFFPLLITVVLVVIASFYIVPTAFVLGVLFDLLYGFNYSLPLGMIVGGGITFIVWRVRIFVRERIMSI
jgi:hypothetical protein